MTAKPPPVTLDSALRKSKAAGGGNAKSADAATGSKKQQAPAGEKAPRA